VLRPGADVTIVSWSRMARDSLAVAQRLAADGIDAEVIDLRTVAPLDWEAVLTSFAKTNRAGGGHRLRRRGGNRRPGGGRRLLEHRRAGGAGRRAADARAVLPGARGRLGAG